VVPMLPPGAGQRGRFPTGSPAPCRGLWAEMAAARSRDQVWAGAARAPTAPCHR